MKVDGKHLRTIWLEADGREPVWKRRLVDDADRPAVGLDPNGARVFAIDLHGARDSRDSWKGKAGRFSLPLPASRKR